jgi:hypothetical protein
VALLVKLSYQGKDSPKNIWLKNNLKGSILKKVILLMGMLLIPLQPTIGCAFLLILDIIMRLLIFYIINCEII